MDSNVYTYVQKRKDFGKQTHFIDSKRVYELLNWPIPAWDRDNKFLAENPLEKRNPNFITLSNMPEMSENTVNTERVNMDTRSMFHYEGGWSKDVDITEEKARQNHIRKRLEKSIEGVDIFTDSCRRMCKNVKDIIKMNNQIDMFEEYFEGEDSKFNVEKLSVKTSMLFKDPEKENKRSINKISWHPDGPTKLAGAYCIMRFQKQPADMSCKSYVWDIKSPNTPCYEINPPSPIVSLAYNHKATDEIAFGCYNGRVGVVDVRNPRLDSSMISEVEFSHHEPVVDLIWLSSKNNTEFVTSSTDGQIFWWDHRKIAKPFDMLHISETDGGRGEDGYPVNMVGGTCLEFVPDHGPKYLIGTEKGSIMLATKKPKKNAEINFNVSYGLNVGRHLGPIYSIKRNPFNYKYFLSVGDWSVNIWEEETKTPIMKTRYHSSYLTDGTWAPQRPGVFFVTRKDGWLDIWDYYYRQNEVAFSHKVSNFSLTTIKLNTTTGASMLGMPHTEDGRYAAIGDANGTITLLELCDSLYKENKPEKDTITEIFEREKKREEHLKAQKLQADNRKRAEAKERETKEKQAADAAKIDINKQMTEIQDQFEQNLKKAADELFKVYLTDNEMTSVLTERLVHGSEKKATKDLNMANEVLRSRAQVPADYDQKVNNLAMGVPEYFSSSKQTFISSFIPITTDTVLASEMRTTDNGKEASTLVEWRCNTQSQGETEIYIFKGEYSWDSSIKDQKPSQIDELFYVFTDNLGRIIGIDKYGKVIVVDYDKTKRAASGARIIAECYALEKNGAAISRDKNHLYYIDKRDATKIWKHNLQNNQRTAYLGGQNDSYNEISGFVLVNEETLFVAFKNSKVCRYDMDKKAYERSVQFEGTPTFICTYLNYIALVGNLKDKAKETGERYEVLLLDHELREVGRYNIREFGSVVWMSLRMSVSKMPVLFVATSRELFALKVHKDCKLERVGLNVDLKELKNPSIHSFRILKNYIFISDREGFLVAPIKGEIDDQERMIALADSLEEQADSGREREDKAINQKVANQTDEAKRVAEEEKKRKQQEEERQRQREAELAKELDPLSHTVGFLNPQLVYHKVEGPKFDKFTVAGDSVYTITEEGKHLSITVTNIKQPNNAPEILFEANDRESGTLTHFEANPEDDSVYFMIGSRLMKCERKRLEVVCDTTYAIHRSEDYFIARGTKGNEYNFYNYITKNLSVESLDLNIRSIYRTSRNTIVITDDKKMHLLSNGASTMNVPIQYDHEVRIVHANDTQIFVILADKNKEGNLETMLNIYDHSLQLQASNKFNLRETDTFTLLNFNLCQSVDGSSTYALINYLGANMPIILKKIGDAKYSQPKTRDPTYLGISNMSDLIVRKNLVYVGTSRKVLQLSLGDKNLPEEKDQQVRNVGEKNLIITAMYKDQLSRVKRSEIQTKEMGQDVLLSRVIVNPDNQDYIYVAKNSKDNVTTVLRYNFGTQSELAVVKEVKKFNKQGFLVDMVVNTENKINAIDDNGCFYAETDKDVMVLTDLQTFPRNSPANLSRSRQIAVNQSRTLGYLVTDDADAVVEVDLLRPETHRVLRGNFNGVQEVKVYRSDMLVGVKRVVTKQRAQYHLFRYDINTEKILDECNMSIPTGYHVEALRLVEDQRILVVANKRSDKDAKSGTSGEMVFALFNLNLEREFMSGDIAVGNKFGVSNVVEVMISLQGLPVVVVSKGATLFLFAIESDSKLKQIDTITFSEADGPDSKLSPNLGTIESACFHNGSLYVVRNKNVLHRVRFEGV